MEFDLTEHNPDFETIKEQRWAYVHINELTGNAGSPHARDEWAESEQSEVRIIHW